MGKLKAIKYCAADLRQFGEYLAQNQAALTAIADAMENKGIDKIDVFYAAEFMRALHKVERFAGSARQGFLKTSLPDVNQDE